MRRKCSRYHSETKNGSKNEPHFQGPKNMDMLQFHANNNVSVTFFSAHCNCADFREILKLQCYKNMKISTFLCCSQQILFFTKACSYTRGKQSAGMFLIVLMVAQHARKPSVVWILLDVVFFYINTPTCMDPLCQASAQSATPFGCRGTRWAS